MKNMNKKISFIYILLIAYVIFVNFIGYKSFSSSMNMIINPLFYLGTLIISILLSESYREQRIKQKKNKLETIFIIVTSYLIIYMFLGLISGYSKSFYNHSIIGIFKNIWAYIFPLIFIEIIRNILVRNSKNVWLSFFIIVIVFTLLDINLYNIVNNATSRADIFKVFFSTIIPSLAVSFVLTYMSKTSGYLSNLVYLIPQELTTLLLPIYPNLDWYFVGLLGVLLPVITFIFVKNKDDKIESTESRRRFKKHSIIKSFIVIFPVVVFALFVAGIFKYKPVAIMSYSMVPTYTRGDAVIVEKISKKNNISLKKYDIIEYKLDNIIVAHRIIYVEDHNDGTVLYITKGDSNKLADREKVTPDQVLGIVRYKVPKVGYPSVWLNDFFNKNNDSVEG